MRALRHLPLPLFTASGYVKVDRCSVLYTADGVVFYHARFLDASLRRLKRKEVNSEFAHLHKLGFTNAIFQKSLNISCRLNGGTSRCMSHRVFAARPYNAERS